MADDSCVVTRRDHDEKPIGDGPANRMLAEYFKPALKKSPPVSFTMLCGGTAYSQSFPKRSKRLMREAKLPSQAPDREYRNIIGAGKTEVPLSSVHGAMMEVQRGRRLADQKEKPEVVYNRPVDNLGSKADFAKSDFMSASQRAFGSRDAAARSEAGFMKDAWARLHERAKNTRDLGDPLPEKTPAFSTVHLGLMGVGASQSLSDLVAK